MRIWQIGTIFLMAALLWSSISLSVAGTAAGAESALPQVAVITSAASDLDKINTNMLRAIFAMRYTKWSDGTPVKVYVFADSDPRHEMFCKQILKFFPYQLRQAWDRQVFSGLGQYPEMVSSTKEMLAKVKATPGSVGYISIQEVDKDVRILQSQP